MPPSDLPSKLRKILSTLQINHLPKIRLRENRKRVSRNLCPCRASLNIPTPSIHLLGSCTARPFNKVRHSPEPLLRDPLQSFPCLERQTVFWDVHFCDGAGAGVDVEACFWIRGVGEFGEDRQFSSSSIGGGECR